MAAVTGGQRLLESAVGYALAGATLATPQLLSRPTPCPGWDLEMLLDHVSDSIWALQEAMAGRGALAASHVARRRALIFPRAWQRADPHAPDLFAIQPDVCVPLGVLGTPMPVLRLRHQGRSDFRGGRELEGSQALGGALAIFGCHLHRSLHSVIWPSPATAISFHAK